MRIEMIRFLFILFISITFTKAYSASIIVEDYLYVPEENDSIILHTSDTTTSIKDNTTKYANNNISEYRFKPTQLIVPGALMAVSITGVFTLNDFKNSVRDKFSGYKKGHTFKADDYIQYTTAIGYVGLGFIPGVKCRSEFNDRLRAGITAYAIMAISVNAMKYSFKHPRPGSGTRNSFPSGHSATVFTGAELMRIEYGNYIGLVGYAVAVTVGALRIYNDRHWVTDVLGGAAIGILSARAGYWLLPLEKKIFKLNKNKNRNKSFAILPMIGETNGLDLTMTF